MIATYFNLFILAALGLGLALIHYIHEHEKSRQEREILQDYFDVLMDIYNQENQKLQDLTSLYNSESVKSKKRRDDIYDGMCIYDATLDAILFWNKKKLLKSIQKKDNYTSLTPYDYVVLYLRQFYSDKRFHNKSGFYMRYWLKISKLKDLVNNVLD